MRDLSSQIGDILKKLGVVMEEINKDADASTASALTTAITILTNMNYNEAIKSGQTEIYWASVELGNKAAPRIAVT